ncbi:phage tail protein [Haematospirillum sp. H1815]|nr:phage tail protein [Haematospirillum sp. H1815]
MGLRYQTRDGDTVDYIAWKHYGGTAPGVVEQLLEANPGLVRYVSGLEASRSVA